MLIVSTGPWSHKASEWFPTIPPVEGHKAHSIVLSPQEKDAVSPHAVFLDYKFLDGSFGDPEMYLSAPPS